MFNYDKLKDAIEQSGKSKAYLCRKLNRPEYYLRDVLKQKNIIPQEYQEILAKELGVTVAWLNDELPPETKKAPVPEDEGEKAKLIRKVTAKLETYSDEQIQAFLDFLEMVDKR